MHPKTEQELADILRTAKAPIRIQGGGTRTIGRPVSGDVLHTSGLSGVTLYEPGALTVVVQAGTALADLEAVLDAEGQRLPFEPMDHRGLLGTSGTPTIGGVVAGNVSGPRRVQAGACRDYMLGVRFVDGSGTIVKNGGRVMKNVTGYDLVKLMTGSWGTLGVLTEVSLKVLPKPATMATLVLRGLDDESAVAAMSRALGSPFDLTGAAHVPVMRGGGNDAGPVTYVRLEGFADSVAYRSQALAAHLATFGTAEIITDPDAVNRLWAWVRDVSPMQGSENDVWKLSVKPGDAPALVARAAPHMALYDWGGGLVWLELPPGTDLRARLGGFAGHATLVRASETTRAALPVFHPDPAPVAALSAGLRARFDPRGLLNTGLMAA